MSGAVEVAEDDDLRAMTEENDVESVAQSELAIVAAAATLTAAFSVSNAPGNLQEEKDDETAGGVENGIEKKVEAGAASDLESETSSHIIGSLDSKLDIDTLTVEELSNSLSSMSVDGVTAWYQAQQAKAAEHFRLDKYFRSLKALEKLESVLEKVGRKNLVKKIRSSELYKTVKQKTEEATDLLKLFEDKSDWKLAHESHGVQTMHRVEPGTASHSFRVSGEVQAPLQNLLACMLEVDLMHNWMPRLKSAKELGSLSRFQKFMHIEINSLWPVANRESVSNCYGVDMTESDKILVFMKSIEEDPNIEVPPLKPGNVRANIILGGFLIEPKSPSACQFSMIINVDPALKHIPSSLINWFTQHFIHYIVIWIRKAANFDETSEYYKRIQTNREIYGYIEQVIADKYGHVITDSRKQSPEIDDSVQSEES